MLPTPPANAQIYPVIPEVNSELPLENAIRLSTVKTFTE
jgi:hypothetical protein